jgi:hypothetical protein
MAVGGTSITMTRKRKATGLGTTNITNTVISLDGTSVPVIKKPRKVRCDKGIERGPRKPKPTNAEAASSSTGDTSVPTSKKSRKARADPATKRKQKDKAAAGAVANPNAESQPPAAAAAKL